MSEKKMAGKNLTIIFGIVCIILAALVAGMVPALVNYTTIIGNKENDIASLNSQIENFHSQIKQYQTDLNGNRTLLSQTQTWLKNNVTSYDAQITNLQKIVNLQEMILLYGDRVVVPSSQGIVVWHNIPSIAPNLAINLEGHQIPIEYAGYLVVVIVFSAGNTSIQVDYSFNQFHYSNTVNTGSTGVAYFPILPTTDLNIKLFNTDLVNLYVTMITITYYY
jgi:ribosomal protein S15P/S13E